MKYVSAISSWVHHLSDMKPFSFIVLDELQAPSKVSFQHGHLQGPSVPTTCGLIALQLIGNSTPLAVEFTAAHCSASMAFGHFHHGMDRPLCKIDRNSIDWEAKINVSGLKSRWKTCHDSEGMRNFEDHKYGNGILHAERSKNT